LQQTFNKYINYLQAERNASPYTVRNYTTDLIGSKNIKGFFSFLAERGIKSLDEVDRIALRDYMAYLMEQGVVKASIARKLSAIRSFYRYLLREEVLTASPAEKTSTPKLDKRLPSFLTIQEMGRLLESPDIAKPQGKRDRAFIELFYASGLRVSELVQLNMEQIDLDAREIRVIGKGSKERMVLMGKPAAEALNVYIKHSRPELMGRRSSSALFLNRYGGRLTERMVQIILAKYARAAGISKKVHPHKLRHTFATHMLDGGADLRVVQELLGHADLSSTQIYTHVTKTQAKKVYLAAHPLAQKKENELEDR